jgi:hypothetical protein
MPDDIFPTCMTTAAASLIDVLAMVEPHQRAVVINFDPGEPQHHTLYSDAAAVDLIPMLRSLLTRLESGAVRMPVTDGVRWVDAELTEEG